MDLYGDLLAPEEKKTTGWTSGLKAMKPRIRKSARPPHKPAPPSTSKTLPKETPPESVSKHGDSDPHPDPVPIESTNDLISEATGLQNKKNWSAVDVDNIYLVFSLDRLELAEEYNPQYPNDYRDVLREREYELGMKLAEEREREWHGEQMEEGKKHSLLHAAGAFGGKAPSLDHLVPPDIAGTPSVDATDPTSSTTPLPLPQSSTPSVRTPSSTPAPTAEVTVPGLSSAPTSNAPITVPTSSPADESRQPQRKRSRWGPKTDPVPSIVPTVDAPVPVYAPVAPRPLPVAMTTTTSSEKLPAATISSSVPIASRMSVRGIDNRPAWMTTTKTADSAPAAGDADATARTNTAEAPMSTSVPTPSSTQTSSLPTTFTSAVSTSVPRQPSHTTDPGTLKSAMRYLPPGTSPKVMNMMLKWGYQPGKGLGKDLSGIATPVVHDVKGKGRGVIRGAAPLVIQVRRRKTKRRKGSKLSAKEAALQQFLAQYDKSSTGLSLHSQSSSAVSTTAAGTDDDTNDWTSSAMDIDRSTDLEEDSPVLLLWNIVVPDAELDDLEAAIAEKMQKFGTIASIHVFQCSSMEVVVEVNESRDQGDISTHSTTLSAPSTASPDHEDTTKKTHTLSLPPGERIRVFVEFASLPDALQAKTAMNGEEWKGNPLIVEQFPLARYRALDLGPSEDDLYRVLGS